MSDRIVGAILAGGEARRMDHARKGLIEKAPGVTIVRYLADEMRAAGIAEVFLVANEEEPYRDTGLQVIADRRRGMGPLAGIESSLTHVAGRSDARGVMIMPCDMPCISRREMRVLADAFLAGDSRIVLAELDAPQRRFPLCCVLHPDVLGDVSAALDRGECKVGHLWRDLHAAVVQFSDEETFQNLNTPEDVASWLGKASP